MSVAASLLERGAPESTGGGDGACDKVQWLQAERSAQVHLQCATGVDAGALEEPMDVEYEWRRRCFEVGAEYMPPSKTENACASRDPRRACSMANGRHKAMKARIAAAVARKAKMEGAQQRAVEERRKADERHAALESKHEAKRRLAEEAKERREAVCDMPSSEACYVSN